MGNREAIIAEVSAGVAAKLIAAIEAGEGDPAGWSKPWQAFTTRHRNPLSNITYHGINPLILSYIQAERGYERPLWVTFNQVKDHGGRLVNAGGQGVRLVRWNSSLNCSIHGTGKYNRVKTRCCDNVRQWGGLTTFHVFNIALVEGIEFPDDDAIVRTEHERIEDVEEFVRTLGVDVRYQDQDRAYFTPSGDYIVMPSASLFHDQRGLYSTLLHEITHWSGNPGRSERAKGNPFGSHGYAMEELVAELGSAMLMQHFGLEPEPHIEHLHYLRNWLTALQEDATYIYTAAQQATKAVRFLLDSAGNAAQAAA